MEDKPSSRNESPRLPKKSYVVRKGRFRKLQRGGNGKNNVNLAKLDDGRG